ncbi:MAG: hypothetical protein KAR79_05390, partial [Simkaniaceae bacterium]|nr:hypothetical protein [Simkaniaceae bacterium]
YVLVGSKPMISFNIDQSNELRIAKRFQTRTLWNMWQKNRIFTLNSKFLFVERNYPFDKQRKMGLFINIPTLIELLKQHYEAFFKIYEKPFDPESIINEISDDHSLFWSKVFQSHYLQGLLYGYGEENAKRFVNKESNGNFPDTHEIARVFFKKKIQVSDLMLPGICYYTESDQTIIKYNQERKKIIEYYSRKNFFELTKSLLVAPN